MRQFIKNTTYRLSSPLSMPFLQRLSGQKFIFPFYHVVANKPAAHSLGLYQTIPVKQFLSDLEFLLKYYLPATKKGLTEFIGNGKNPSTPRFFLSFDDGMRECYDVVAPILKDKGLEAAFFINPAFVDNKALFFRQKISLITGKIKTDGMPGEIAELLNLKRKPADLILEKINALQYSEEKLIGQIAEIAGIDFNEYLKKHKPFMSLEQIRSLKQQGFLIGSHSYDHPRFWEIDEEERKEQLRKSFDYIATKIKPEIRTFAFPFSDIEMPASFFQFLKEEIKIDISFGTAGLKKDSSPFHLQRIPMDTENKPAKRTIREEYAYFVFKSFFRKNTIQRI